MYVPKSGVPTAITHNIEQGPWRDWPAAWRRERYSTWQELEGYIAGLVRGKKIAMEYSPGDAVPYVDYVPAGVLEMVRTAGATVVCSGEIVTKFYAVWTEPQMASHVRAAEQVRATALEAFAFAGAALAKGTPVHEHEVQRFIMDSFVKKGMEFDHDPIVAAGANAADAHYSPSEKRPRALARGELLLIDLWAREPGGIYADQTFMAALGAPSARAVEVWTAVRDARDAAIARLTELVAAGKPVRGGEIDDAARGVITAARVREILHAPHGPQHRHAAAARRGPAHRQLRDARGAPAHPGAGFSIEPGVYIGGEIGARSEVNAFIDLKGHLVVTPREYQRELPVY